MHCAEVYGYGEGHPVVRGDMHHLTHCDAVSRIEKK